MKINKGSLQCREKTGHLQKPVFNVDESMSVEDADSASEKLFVVKTLCLQSGNAHWGCYPQPLG